MREGDMRGDVARRNRPLAHAVGIVAVELAGGYVIARIGNQNLARLGIDRYAVGHHDLTLRAVLNEMTINHFA